MNYLINKDVKNLINLAETNKTAGKLQEAKTFLKKAIKIEPTNKIALNNIANIYKEMKDFDKSIRYYLKCIFSNPLYIIGKINLAILYHEIGKLEDAQKIYKEIIDSDKLNFGIYFKLSDINFDYFTEEIIKFIEFSINTKNVSTDNKAAGYFVLAKARIRISN